MIVDSSIRLPKVTEFPGMLKKDLELKVTNLFMRVKELGEFPEHGYMQKAKNHLLEKVKEVKVEEANFFEDDGQCRGASEWFVTLYLHAKKRYPDIPLKALLVTITKEFENGVNVDGAILQKYQNEGLHEELLKELNISCQKMQNDETFLSPNQVDNLEEYGVKFLKDVAALEDGTYILGFRGTKDSPIWGFKGTKGMPGHATVIIKEDKEYYFFDPNVGLIGTNMENGINKQDVTWFFTISQQYFPLQLATDYFNKSLDELVNKLGDKQGKFVDGMIKMLRNKNLLNKSYCLNAYEWGAVSDAFKKKFPEPYSKEVEQMIFDHMTYNPGMNHLKLTEGEGFYFQRVSLRN